MSRLLLARGSRGALVETVQRGLGFAKDEVDGIYGGGTEAGVSEFQTKNGQNTTGQVDTDSWKAITSLPTPGLFGRALQLTADFEGHGFTLAQGNFDGAGITWGIIGFTLASGEIPEIVSVINSTNPQLIKSAFDDLAPKLLQIIKASPQKQIEFADSISIGPKKVRLAEPWRSSFGVFGSFAEVQRLQMERAQSRYFEPALATASRLRLTTELGVALCFDVHVQNGGVKNAIETSLRGKNFSSERKLRIALANAVADSSRPKYQEDVRSRKLTLATGSGTVHGAKFVTPNWGLDELPAV